MKKNYRIAIPASLVFDVQADDDYEAIGLAREMAPQPLDECEGKDMKDWPGGRLYLWPAGDSEVAIEDVQEPDEEEDPDEQQSLELLRDAEEQYIYTAPESMVRVVMPLKTLRHAVDALKLLVIRK
jgi:hypothetical protein